MLATGCGSGVVTAIPGTTPALSLSATTLNLGSILLSTSSSAQTVTLTNIGTGTLTFSNIATTGDFSQTSSGCGVGLVANANCTVSVVFNPTQIGSRTGTLSITSNAQSAAQTVALTGTGAPAIAVLALSSTTVAFGTLIHGQSSAPYEILATNIGVAPLTISNIASSGDFSQTNNCALLPIHASCSIYVTFNANVTGARTGTLTVANTAPAGTLTADLSGTSSPSFVTIGPPFQIQVQAGKMPIANASVQVYTPGVTGNGSAPTALLPGPLTSSSSGIVTVPAGFLCPSFAPVYAVSRGGTVSGTSAANPQIALMTAIGVCNTINTGAKFYIDEATTVAAVDSLAPFYALGGSIGSSGSNLLGLTSAFATAATLADPTTGLSPGSTLPINAVSPAPRVNSLANILNACTASSSACGALFTATTVGPTVPTDTADAAYLLATHPGSNVATLYTQSQASTAFTPAVAKAPTDWSMFITYSGGGLSTPSGIGVDSKGNVWVASYFSAASKFTPTGTPVFPSGITGSGLNNSYGLAIDPNDNVWIPNEQPFTAVGIGSVSELSSAGASLAGTGYLNGGMNYPISVAIDPNGTVWVVDYGNSHLTLLNSSGTPLSGTTGYTTPLFAFPVAVAVDANHFGWIVNQSSNNVTKVAPDGSSFTNFTCCNLASGIAIDQGNNVWVANYFGDNVSLLTNSGTVIGNNYTANGSVDHPQGIAVDGGGSVWVANYRASHLSKLAGSTATVPGAALSPSIGIGADAALLEAYAIAIDASGNLWISNQGNSTVTKFVGLAVPVKTPLSGLPQLP